MADFDAIYEEEEEHEENIEDNYVALVPDPVIIRGAGNMTVSSSIPDSPRSPSPPLRGDPPPPVLQPYDGLPNAPTAPPPLTPPPLTPSSPPPPQSSPPPTLTPIYDDPPDCNSNHIDENTTQSNHLPLLSMINNISTVNDISRRELIDIKNHNHSLKKLAYKEVRRPGKNYAPLLKHLEMVKGNTEDRVNFLKDIINECLRFKRTKMANKVEEVLQNVMSTQMFRTPNNGTT